MAQILFTIVQIIWGAPQTLLGLVLYVATAGCPRFSFHGARGTVWKRASSVSLGLFIFVAEHALSNAQETQHKHVTNTANTSTAPDSLSTTHATNTPQAVANNPLVVHEYGHCIQSLIFGPLYLMVFGLPSFIWAMLPALRKRRTRTGKSYYSFYTERFANYLAARTIK